MTEPIKLPPLPAGYAPEVAAAMRNYARAEIEADRQTNKTLMHYMPETIATLKAAGCNESLVTDIEKAMRGEADRQASGEPVAQVTVNDDGTQTWVALKTQWLPKGVHTLYTAPQPQQPIPTDDDPCDKTLRDRDHYHDMADKLAEAIAEHFCADIGEHSSANCPWEMALEVIEAAPQPQQIPENVKQAIQMAYGHLWMVNNEPGTPHQYSPEEAAYKARRLLRGFLTKEERGDGINSAMLEAAPEPK